MARTIFSLFFGLAIACYVSLIPFSHLGRMGVAGPIYSVPVNVEQWLSGLPFPYVFENRYTYSIGNQTLSVDTKAYEPPLFLFDWLFFSSLTRVGIACADRFMKASKKSKMQTVMRLFVICSVTLFFMAFLNIGEPIAEIVLAVVLIPSAMVGEHFANSEEARS